MLNKYAWDLYLRSGGSEVVRFFKAQLSECFTEEFLGFISGLHKSYCPMKRVTDWIGVDLREVYYRIYDDRYLLSDGDYCIESAIETIYAQLLFKCGGNVKAAFEKFSADIVIYTTLLSVELTELFVPYYFQCESRVKMVLKNSAT